MMHLLWCYGLKAWIVVIVSLISLVLLAYWREGRRERRFGDRPWE